MANWTTAGKKGLAIDLTKAWETGAARQRMWDYFGWDGNDPPNASGGKTRTGFLMYDADAPDLKGSYSLPFCDVVDGKLMALASGCRAAASRLPQKQGVSDEERNKARAILDDYFARIEEMQRAIDGGALTEDVQAADRLLNVQREDDEETAIDDIAATITQERATPPATTEELADTSSSDSPSVAASVDERASVPPRITIRAQDIEEARKAKQITPFEHRPSRQVDGDDENSPLSVFAHPASVRQIDTRARIDLLALAKERAFSPEILDQVAPFFWGAEISSTRIDAYYTRMAVSTLRNYATDAKAGVSFQNSHNVYELGLGRSLTGRFFNGDLNSEDAPPHVEASFFTIPGMTAGGISTDQFMVGVQVGMYRDVSVGFYGGSMRCSICNRDIWDWDCMHVPGVQYELRDDSGEKTGKRELAIAWIEDAHLAEVSIVYDGATPGAAILKAQQEADAGRLQPVTARLLEARYRIKLPGAARRYAGVEIPEREADMGNTPNAREATSSPAPAGEDVQTTSVATDPTPAEETRAPSPREVIAEAVGASVTVDESTETAETVREVTVSVSNEGATTVSVSPAAEAAQPAATQEERAPDPVEAIFAEAAAPNAGVNEGTTSNGANSIVVTTGLVSVQGEPLRAAANGTASHATMTAPAPATPDPAIAELASIRAVLTEVGVPAGVDPARAIRGLASKVLELTPQARDGRQYRVDLIEETLADGIAANGVDWNPDPWRAVLQGATLDQVKAIRHDFRNLAKKTFGSGGRMTVEAEDSAPALDALDQAGTAAHSQERAIDPFWPDEDLPSSAFAS